jgi:hypothetical protein
MVITINQTDLNENNSTRGGDSRKNVLATGHQIESDRQLHHQQMQDAVTAAVGNYTFVCSVNNTRQNYVHQESNHSLGDQISRTNLRGMRPSHVDSH